MVLGQKNLLQGGKNCTGHSSTRKHLILKVGGKAECLQCSSICDRRQSLSLQSICKMSDHRQGIRVCHSQDVEL